MVPFLLHACLGLCVAVCALLFCLLYATPDIGYDIYTGVVHCFCGVVSKTSPHSAFILHILSGLLLLCLCAKAVDSEEKQTGTILLSGIFFVSLTGLLSFDIIKYTAIHSVFVLILFISALAFSLYSLQWANSELHRAGTIAFCIALGIFFLNPLLDGFPFYFEEITAWNVTNHVQLICITAMLFMFGVYVYS